MSFAERLTDAPSGLLRRLDAAGYLRKWLVLSVAIGVVAGIGAIVFVNAIRLCEWLLLDVVGGYVPPSSLGEGSSPGTDFSRPWAIPLVVGLGGLLAGAIVFRFAPEAEGHGTDAAIHAVHHNPRGVRSRVSIVKIVASAITIGSGGSAGREGPTAQISSGFASLLARRLDLTPTDARIAMTVGIGAGIGAVFRAPLGGAVLGAEILYRDDIEAEALFPSFVASITGFAIFGAVEGFTPIFGFLEPGHFTDPLQLAYYAAIGVLAGILGVLYARSFYATVSLSGRLAVPAWLKPALAGLAVGTLGLAIPGALGTGYGWLQRAMNDGTIFTIPLWMIIALPFAKILATSLTIGSGGSGGIFGPGMVIGGFLGATAWRLLEGMPSVPATPAPFVIVAMIACFGSIAHAPLAMILMVAEMTGNLELVAPAMVAVGLATLVVGDRSIYEHQLKDRREAPAHRFRFGMPLLASVRVSEAMGPVTLTVRSDASVAEARRMLRESEVDTTLTVDAKGVFRGTIDVAELDRAPDDRTVGSVTDPGAPAVPSDATLDAVVEILAATGVEVVPVLDDARVPIGVVTAAETVRGYRMALRANLGMIGSVPKGTELLEGRLSEGSSAVGRQVSAIRWPPGSVIVAIQRKEQMLLPHADTTLLAGDTVSMLAPAGRSDEVRALIGQAPDGP